MRHSIAHAILACLRTLIALFLPATGRRRKCCVQPRAVAEPQSGTPSGTPSVIPESPWSRPWTSPSKEEAAAIFRRQAEARARAEAAEVQRQRERRRAAAYAAAGLEYPYTYEGAPFGAEAFANVMRETA
ncbi:hypothetical protein IAG44_21210 [Streptomyces roseirectus]|uniref:Uncharacterized protein n=1 Tax=Streptomyces roseirectus TaxID=2768066 RepID=A0A7H0IFY1_9ACTN|nr:hypothetical protein [Streptomyces roseirectus]QNP71697.1 hypothetical protein IAG44_21210 [Streptomyces roseirectus]